MDISQRCSCFYWYHTHISLASTLALWLVHFHPISSHHILQWLTYMSLFLFYTTFSFIMINIHMNEFQTELTSELCESNYTQIFFNSKYYGITRSAIGWIRGCGTMDRGIVDMERKWKSLSRVWLFATPWTVAHQAPISMEFSRHEYWSGLPFPSPGDLSDPGIKPRSPTLQADSLPSKWPGKPLKLFVFFCGFLLLLFW